MLSEQDAPPKRLEAQSPIAVVGGSLTGPTLALLLKREGFDNVKVYEATPPTVSQAGGAIGIDHVSLGVLDAIGVDQDEFVPFPSERVVSVKIKSRREVGRVVTLYPGRTTTWNLLHGALARRLSERSFQTGRRVVGVDADESERGRLTFADGSVESADLICFADGRRSTGRRLLDPERALHYAGYVVHRGQAAAGGIDWRDFMSYKPDGTQFNAFPIPFEGGVGVDWAFYLAASAERFREHFGGDPTRRTFVLPHQVSDEARKRVDEAARRMLPEHEADLVCATPLRMAAPVVDVDPPTWTYTTVGATPAVLIGDALAPVRPHTGRGANNGIDQAAGLAVALGQHVHHGANLLSALDAWQTRFLPQVHASIARGPQMAYEIGLEV